MKEKSKASPIEIIRAIIQNQNGIIFSSDLARQGIPRTYLSILEEKGEIQRIARGVYSASHAIADEMAWIQARYQRAAFSHETALYLWDLTDRSPLFYSMTVPSGYNATLLKANGVKVFFVSHNLYSLGLIMAKSPHGNPIRSFDLERTLCDVLRSRNKIDVQLVNQALKRYVVMPERDIGLLYRYAASFRIQKIVREYLEVLL